MRADVQGRIDTTFEIALIFVNCNGVKPSLKGQEGWLLVYGPPTQNPERESMLF